LLILSQLPGTLKKFRNTPWRFQQTFRTPLQGLRPFVTTIVSAKEPLQSGSVTVDQVVFEPKNWLALLARHSLPSEYGREWTITARDTGEVEELLEPALSDWLHFLFVPTPKPFVIYADPDEFITFYANKKSNLNEVVEALSAENFKVVSGFERVF
jgi:hypothetical protein